MSIRWFAFLLSIYRISGCQWGFFYRWKSAVQQPRLLHVGTLQLGLKGTKLTQTGFEVSVTGTLRFGKLSSIVRKKTPLSSTCSNCIIHFLFIFFSCVSLSFTMNIYVHLPFTFLCLYNLRACKQLWCSLYLLKYQNAGSGRIHTAL